MLRPRGRPIPLIPSLLGVTLTLVGCRRHSLDMQIMVYRILKQRKRLHTGVFIFWLTFFGAASVLAALITVGAIPATI